MFGKLLQTSFIYTGQLYQFCTVLPKDPVRIIACCSIVTAGGNVNEEIKTYQTYSCYFQGPMWRQIRGLGLSYHYRFNIKNMQFFFAFQMVFLTNIFRIYSMFCDPEQGLLYFILFKASHLVKAYEKAKEIMVRTRFTDIHSLPHFVTLIFCSQDDYLSGNVPFEAVQLESAISSVIFEIIGQEECVGDASFEVRDFKEQLLIF